MSEKTTVFYFSCIPYDFLYQRPQQLLREWRANFADSYAFYYVEYPAVRRFMARRFHHLKQSLETLLLKKHNKNAEDAFILTWLGVPRFFRGSAIRRTLRHRCGKTQKKVAIVASQFWEPFVSKDDFDLVCYDYLDPIEHTVDDFYSVQEQHKKLLGKSDIIFVTAQNLREDALSIADEKDVLTVSNGTDAEFFEMNKNSCEITDYTRTDRKRVGYMGTYWTVDMDLIYAAAQELTDVDFLLIGPPDGQNQRRARQKPDNVFILGTKERKQLPAYAQMFDVALIPFKPSIQTDAIDPVKLYEYFSLGKPVVATRIRELKKFDDGHLLRVAETQDEFVNDINAFLKYDAKAWQESRRQIAWQNSWLSKASVIMTNIERKLAKQPCATEA
jgi:glycosyltransferase involved in cell wall biosynthesis